jgi:hypothetical protein
MKHSGRVGNFNEIEKRRWPTIPTIGNHTSFGGRKRLRVEFHKYSK